MVLEKNLLDGSPAVLPQPDPGGAGRRTICLLATLAVLLVGSAAFWLTRDDATRLRWREEAANALNTATEGTALAGVGNVLRAAPPPLPEAVVKPMTLPGTLAGQTVQGPVAPTGSSTAHITASQTVAASGSNDAVVAAQMPSKQGESVQSGQGSPAGNEAVATLPRVTEDSRVRPHVVEDLAAWLVSRYKDGGRTGTLNVSVQSLNQRYGAMLVTASSQGRGGRDALMRYAFHPTMLRGLYNLYVVRFLEALNREAVARGFTPRQIGQFRSALAGRMAQLADALEGVASMTGLLARLEAVDKAAQDVTNINAHMADVLFELQQLRENRATGAQISTLALRAEGLAARYRRALDIQTKTERTLVAAIRQTGGGLLDDDTLLFLARWVGRRVKQDAQALDSVHAAAGILRDFVQRSGQGLQGEAYVAAQGDEQAETSAHNLPRQSLPLPAGKTGMQPSAAGEKPSGFADSRSWPHSVLTLPEPPARLPDAEVMP
ncbi:MAG: hypothetical protein IJU37_02645 [Desulfovibrio sp.]|nr:hypothetical protein [Desulfovibrio sp.]